MPHAPIEGPIALGVGVDDPRGVVDPVRVGSEVVQDSEETAGEEGRPDDDARQDFGEGVAGRGGDVLGVEGVDGGVW